MLVWSLEADMMFEQSTAKLVLSGHQPRETGCFDLYILALSLPPPSREIALNLSRMLHSLSGLTAIYCRHRYGRSIFHRAYHGGVHRYMISCFFSTCGVPILEVEVCIYWLELSRYASCAGFPALRHVTCPKSVRRRTLPVGRISFGWELTDARSPQCQRMTMSVAMKSVLMG